MQERRVASMRIRSVPTARSPQHPAKLESMGQRCDAVREDVAERDKEEEKQDERGACPEVERGRGECTEAFPERGFRRWGEEGDVEGRGGGGGWEAWGGWGYDDGWEGRLF